MTWIIDAIPDQRGRRILITGGNTGLGFESARELAARHASVIIACRDIAKGEAARRRILAHHPFADVSVEALDLASLASVRACARRLLQQNVPLDVLINNAGVMTPPLGFSAEGFELQFGVNVLGHFALTGLMMPLLMQSPAARVVTLSSTAHRIARMDVGNLRAERGYRATQAYAMSKLGNLLFAYELQRRLQQRGSTAMSIAAHPGVSLTELARTNGLIGIMMKLVSQNAADGARSQLMAATDPALKGGEYIGPGGFQALKGPPTVQQSSAASRDPQMAATLWNLMQEASGVRFP
jgi:NAD(P)-dependent dehydrogenase (short-subunit alcohol dehydrogenase family)